MSSRHYYSRSPRRAPRKLVSDAILGVTVEFYTAPGVFSYKGVDEGTRILLEAARIPREGRVLDLGAGYGAIGITIAKAFPGVRVVMVEVNPLAYRLLKQNIRLNSVEDRAEARLGSLYEPLEPGEKFNLIITNPPISAGSPVLEEIITGAPRHLEPGGSLQMVLRKGAEKAEKLMEEVFGRVEVLARRRGYTVLAAWLRP